MLSMTCTPRRNVAHPFTDLDRVFDTLLAPIAFASPAAQILRSDASCACDWVPALDIVERGEGITVRAEVPGVDPDKIDVTVQDDVLTIRGSKEESREENSENILRTERRFGSFIRQVALPGPVDEANVHATYKNGVLTVDLTRSAAAQPRRIPVKNEGR